MSETEILQRLVASNSYVALQKLKPKFNLFSLLDDALREPAWSRLFSGMLDSTVPHGLGNKALCAWLLRVDDEVRTKGARLPGFFQTVSPDLITRTTVEYTTPKGRHVDILVRILDAKHRVVAVVGIENKLSSPEQPSQLADYQAALTEVFPDAHQLIVYFTPDGREAQTADPSAKCPYLPASYETMVATCQSLSLHALPRVGVLLQSLCEEIKGVVLGESAMQKEAKQLIQKLWADSDHRRAMRLISECIPTPRKLWDSGLTNRIEHDLKAIRIEFQPVYYYPQRSESPHEIKFECAGTVGDIAEKAGFYLIYMLHCSDKNPDIGSEFCLRLMAWCEAPKARQRVKDTHLERGLPAGGALRHWSKWENIWTGGSYSLQDFGALDREGMAMLLLDGARQTYPIIAKKVAKLGK